MKKNLLCETRESTVKKESREQEGKKENKQMFSRTEESNAEQCPEHHRCSIKYGDKLIK